MDLDNREANHSPENDFDATIGDGDQSPDEHLNEMASLKRQNALIKSTDNVQQENFKQIYIQSPWRNTQNSSILISREFRTLRKSSG